MPRSSRNTWIGNAEPFEKRNVACFHKGKKNRIGFPCAEGANGFCFCFVFKWSPEASAIILGTLPLTHYMLT